MKSSVSLTPAHNGKKSAMLSALWAAKEQRRELVAQCEQLRQDGKLTKTLLQSGISDAELPGDIRHLLADERADKTTVALNVQLPVWMYGYLCTAAKVHDLDSWEDAAVEFMNDRLTEWANDSYFMLNADYLEKR